eukprot:gene8820-8999_t
MKRPGGGVIGITGIIAPQATADVPEADADADIDDDMDMFASSTEDALDEAERDSDEGTQAVDRASLLERMLTRSLYGEDEDEDDEAQEDEEEEEEEEAELEAEENPDAALNSAGWKQLSGLIGPQQLARLNDLMRADAIRIKELSQWELGILFQALHNLQQGDELSRREVQVLLRFLNEADVTTDGHEVDLNETLRQRSRALRKARSPPSKTLGRFAAGRGSAAGGSAQVKDRAYKQDTRSVSVPKAFDQLSRIEQAWDSLVTSPAAAVPDDS